MSFDEFDYTPNEIDSDTFLSEVPIALMKENIIAQFEDPLEHRKRDHITTFINMYKYSEEHADVYEDEDMDNFIELRDDFYIFIQQIFHDFLNIGFVDFDEMSKKKQDDLIHYTYRFFLMNIKKNWVCYIINYIEENKKSYTYDEKKKDITTLSFKKEITNENDMYIISNLGNIIDDILSEDISVDEFLEKCDTENVCLETRFVRNKFNKFIITGNFVDKYKEMIDYNFKSEIESKIRNKILKKYKNK